MLLLLNLLEFDESPVYVELCGSVVQSGSGQSMSGVGHHQIGSGWAAGS